MLNSNDAAVSKLPDVLFLQSVLYAFSAFISNLLSDDGIGQPACVHPRILIKYSLWPLCVCESVLFDMDVLPYLLGLSSSAMTFKF